MLQLYKALRRAKDGKQHTFTFVVKGDERRKGGYFKHVTGFVSSDYHKGTINVVCTDDVTRKFYKLLLVRFDKQEVFL